jgi:hypothetical protein
MSKAPPKKREPTLRELLERDAKYPLPEIGIGDDFNKSPVENAVSDGDLQRLGNWLEAKNYQDKLSFVESRDAHKIPIPKTSVGEMIANAFLGAKPAGVRTDTELAMLREANPGLVRDRRNMAFMKMVKSPQGFAPIQDTESLRDLFGIPRK